MCRSLRLPSRQEPIFISPISWKVRVFADRLGSEPFELILERNPSGLNYFEFIQHILDVQFLFRVAHLNLELL